MSRLPDPAERVEHLRIELPRIRLPRHRALFGESHPLGHHAVKLFDLRMIAAEQLQKRGLRAGGSLRSTEPQPLDPRFNLFEVEHQIVAP